MGEREISASFPVYFVNGDTEINLGNIRIHSSLDFKTFQSTISKKIGTSFNGIAIYLVDCRKSKSSSDGRRVLITGRSNFSLIASEINCCFLVVLKRSPRHRSSVPQQMDLSSSMFPPRRNRSDLNSPPDVLEYYPDYSRFSDLQIHRESYMNMPIREFELPLNLSFPMQSVLKVEDVYAATEESRAYCEECREAKKKGESGSFHHCIYDPIVLGFHTWSPFGHVARPSKYYN